MVLCVSIINNFHVDARDVSYLTCKCNFCLNKANLFKMLLSDAKLPVL